MRRIVLAAGCILLHPLVHAQSAIHIAPSEALIWSDEFNGAAHSQPNPSNWTYDAGQGYWGNNELETYCAWNSSIAPCDAAQPNVYIGGDGYLHIIARSPKEGVYTSARLKSQGLRSFRYGRIEARIRIPEGQGIWPAFWMLGNDIDSVSWPACGELDIMENIGRNPATVYSSIHGTGFGLTKELSLQAGHQLASEFHIYGMKWSLGSIDFYLDNPANIFATYKPKDLTKGEPWPFDGERFFLLLNVAVGGDWPGNPDGTTRLPQEMLVDYVRVYSPSSPLAP